LCRPLQLLRERSGDAVLSDKEFQRLWCHSAEFLLARSEQHPESPKDWRQDLKIVCRCEDCRELQAFASDPATQIDEATAADRRAHLNAAAAHWHVCRLSLDIVDRARRQFPSEPVRTLDAIHLASALAVRSTIPGVELLSLDDRIRRAGEQLGFRLQPR
jgi:predicted nucleic acid-binding protein